MSNLVNDFEVRKETLRALGGDPTGLSNIFEVDKEILRLTQQGGSGIPDAPIDGVQYARQDGTWTPVEKGLNWNTIKQKLANDGVESIKFIMGAEEVILTASELKTLLNQTVLPDAPSDGKQYARQDGAWSVVEGILDAPIDGVQYARQNGEWTPVEEGLTDSPSDGKTYGRNNGAWTAVKEGISDAPLDGVQYARQNGEWTPVQIPTVEKYMTITVLDGDTGETVIRPNVKGSLPNLNLQYRINNGSWNDFIVGTTADIKVVAGDVVQWKGLNPSGLSADSSNYLNFAISGNPVHLSGNVMSLIDGVGDTLVIPNNFCFFKMFSKSKVKKVSSDFLPATELKNYCYNDLFNECSLLENSPELPSLTMKYGCYMGMFYGCQNFTQAPSLPSLNLAERCYSSMFYGCQKLTQAPSLPAEISAPYCYSSMFFGCQKLTQAPVLNCKTLVNNCYNWMFRNCFLLNYVESRATEGTINADGTAPSALKDWLEGVANTGTFVKPDGVSYETGGNGIPSGWTVKEDDVIEVPNDGKQYSRKDGVWVESEPSKVKTTNNTTMQFWRGTQQEYDAIATKDANTLYVIS